MFNSNCHPERNEEPLSSYAPVARQRSFSDFLEQADHNDTFLKD